MCERIEYNRNDPTLYYAPYDLHRFDDEIFYIYSTVIILILINGRSILKLHNSNNKLFVPRNWYYRDEEQR
ncbi:unnamed protein product [Rhizophagus irregularis]|nr:unnamed protein product [Rhizophagus irregularis]